MAFKRVVLKTYLDSLDKKFLLNQDLWYKAILPREKADEFKLKYNGRYSQIWHVHCSKCWTQIDNNSIFCYYDEETKDWLCNDCFLKLISNS